MRPEVQDSQYLPWVAVEETPVDLVEALLVLDQHSLVEADQMRSDLPDHIPDPSRTGGITLLALARQAYTADLAVCQQWSPLMKHAS